MTRSILIAAMLASSVLCSAQQPKAADSTTNTITIRVLNGKTGKPVAGDLSNVWLGNGGTQIFETDAKGGIQLSVGDVQPRTLRFLPNYYVDCRYKKDTPAAMHFEISLDKVITEGVVAVNLCGNQHQKPVPGVLVIYVRNRTFWEGIRN